MTTEIQERLNITLTIFDEEERVASSLIAHIIACLLELQTV
jgi:hypothetical protein